MTTALGPELSRYRWSSHDEADRFPVEDPATSEVIALVQGAGTPR
jgi:betaine-aldehyde dehydrogenase